MPEEPAHAGPIQQLRNDERNEITGWLNGRSGDRWLKNPKRNGLISYAYNAWRQGHLRREPGKQQAAADRGIRTLGNTGIRISRNQRLSHAPRWAYLGLPAYGSSELPIFG